MTGVVYWEELQLYGTSCLGSWYPELNVSGGADGAVALWSSTNKKQYELSNHLGNVLAAVTDELKADNKALVMSANDYYPFGMIQPDRSYSSGGYRYGFNGKENDNEVKGDGNQQDYGMRVYDPRVGKFLSVDPLTEKYPYYTPYQFAGNKPIWATDLDGGEEKYFNVNVQLDTKGALKEITYVEVENPYGNLKGFHETYEGLKWYDGYGPKGKRLEFNYNVFQAQSDGSNILVGSRVDFVPVPTFAEK